MGEKIVRCLWDDRYRDDFFKGTPPNRTGETETPPDRVGGVETPPNCAGEAETPSNLVVEAETLPDLDFLHRKKAY